MIVKLLFQDPPAVDLRSHVNEILVRHVLEGTVLDRLATLGLGFCLGVEVLRHFPGFVSIHGAE